MQQVSMALVAQADEHLRLAVSQIDESSELARSNTLAELQDAKERLTRRLISMERQAAPIYVVRRHHEMLHTLDMAIATAYSLQ
jgi:hypothetical protein